MPHWQAWRDAGFADALRHRAGLPVLVKNDAPASSFVDCYVGRGTGAGLIIDAAAIIRLHRLRDHRPMQWLKAASDTLRDLTVVFAVPFAPEFIAVGGGLPRQLIQTLVAMAYPLRPTPAARRDRTEARLVAAELIEDAALWGTALLPIFVNTSPSFRALYARQRPQVHRAFER